MSNSMDDQDMYHFCKRVFDIFAAIIGVVLLLPLLLVVALVIKLTSRGPIMYRGVRTGLNGKPFRIFKFRTMIPNAEYVGGTTTGKDDVRLTPIGKVLRKYKLDELPQLFNVILGNMSLVGPRPEVEEYTKLFDENERRILSVRPGITDLSSIRFHDLQSCVGTDDPDRVFRETILPQKNALRLQYVEQQSLWMDINILFQTLYVILTKSLRRT